ncbi:MAG: DUF4153 domain-containing protein [Tissierellia bacterium]|nr:DUF4153 domain-containing protein [Tissierellia bacterium]
MELLRGIWKNLKNTKISFQRFPIPMIFSMIAAYFLIRQNHSDDSNFTYLREILTAIYGFFAFLLVRLLASSMEKKTSKSRTLVALAYCGAILALGGIYYILRPDSTGQVLILDRPYMYYGGLIATIIGCSFVAKLDRWEGFVSYILRILYAEALALSYTIVLYLGISSVIFALDKLLGIPIDYRTYFDAFYICGATFQAGVFLSNYPKAEVIYEKYSMSKPLGVLLMYIVTPLLILYSGILYIYFGKLFITKSMPVHLISGLVLSYGVVSVANTFFQVKLKQVDFSKKVVKIYPYLSLPLFLMFFIALYLRIKAYGFTENRYMGLLLGIWLTFATIYFIIKKGKDTIILAIVLFFIVIIGSFGPMSAYHVAASSQSMRLEKILRENQMLQGDKIVGNKKINTEVKHEVSEILEYMDRHHELKEIAFLPEGFTMDDMTEVLGFELELPETVADSNKYFYSVDEEAINITGFHQLYRGDIYSGNVVRTGPYEYKTENNQIVITKIQEVPKEILRIPILDIGKKMETLNRDGAFSGDELSIIGESEGIKYKFIFTELNFYGGEMDVNNFNASFYLLVNEPEK